MKFYSVEKVCWIEYRHGYTATCCTVMARFTFTLKLNLFRVNGDLSKLMVTHEVVPETVGQYTGITDKNGTKIFEGDILLCEYPSSVWRGYVVWGKGCFSVKSYSGKNCPAIDIVLHYGHVEVIGNIHCNHELIGVVMDG